VPDRPLAYINHIEWILNKLPNMSQDKWWVEESDSTYYLCWWLICCCSTSFWVFNFCFWPEQEIVIFMSGTAFAVLAENGQTQIRYVTIQRMDVHLTVHVLTCTFLKTPPPPPLVHLTLNVILCQWHICHQNMT
jgi:hypothetical protein